MGLYLLTRLRFGLSHLNKHRFDHNHNQSCINPLCSCINPICSCINPICSCSLAIESTTHFFTALASFLKYLLNSLKQHNEVLGSITNISDLSDCAFVKILLFGDQNDTQVENACIINATIVFGRFREYLVHFCSGT